MDTAKLECLLIKEVSGVDAPANLLDGWMVQKASKFKTSLPIGPDGEAWDVAAAEKRVRAETGAEVSPTKAYASCFLWFDRDVEKNADAVPSNFGAYKFLVVDVVDGVLKVMPEALRTAAAGISASSLSDANKAAVASTLASLESRAGAASADAEDAPNTLEKIRNLLFPTRKEVDDMTVDELNAALDAREDALVEKVAEVVIAKSAAPVQGAPGTETAAPVTPAAPAAEAPEAQTAEETAAVLKSAVEEALGPYNEILEATLNRIAGIEKALGIVSRKSLDGQENGAGETPEGEPAAKSATIGDAFATLVKATRNGERLQLVGQ